MEFDDERIEVNREKLVSVLQHLYAYSECYNLYNWVHGRLCDNKRQHDGHHCFSECPFCDWDTLEDWLQDELNEDPVEETWEIYTAPGECACVLKGDQLSMKED